MGESLEKNNNTADKTNKREVWTYAPQLLSLQEEDTADVYLEKALWEATQVPQDKLQEQLQHEMDQNMMRLEEIIAKTIDISTIPTDRYKKLVKNMIDDFLSLSWSFVQEYAVKLMDSENPNVNYNEVGEKFISLAKNSIQKHLKKITWVEKLVFKQLTKPYPDLKEKVIDHINDVVREVSWMVQRTVLGVLRNDQRVKWINEDSDRVNRKKQIKPIVDDIL
jgi:hypothetical protein